MNFKNQRVTKTKLVATAGPTFQEYDHMKEMIMAGVNVVRLNTSHGDYEEHGGRIDNVKKIRKELNLPVSLMLDTKGPEIRIHTFEDKSIKVPYGKKMQIFTKEEIVGNQDKFSVTYTELSNIVEPGTKILCDDGKLTFNVDAVNVETGVIDVTSENKHKLSNNKAVNVPGVKLTLPFIGERDRDFII
jgi:pyruvate kinase